MATTPEQPAKPAPSEIAARCHEIQTGLSNTVVADFERLAEIGMAVRLALHIRGLISVNYETLRLVAITYLGIDPNAVKQVVRLLADIEFVKLTTEGQTIKAVIPNVPYYETLYNTLGEFAVSGGFNEMEQLSIDMLSRLSKTPEKVDTLRSKLGVEPRQMERALELGKKGSYFNVHRVRGRDIVLSPTYFSENADIYADMVAGNGSPQVTKLMTALRKMQGVPLALILNKKEIGGVPLSTEEIQLLVRLGQDGAVKPPMINTTHAGENFFLFTPTPSGAALAPTKRDIYEKAMAIVAAVRQGEFLSKQYRIRSPGAVLWTLRNELKLKRANTEATQQYANLVQLRVARLNDAGNGFKQLVIIDTPENKEAVNIAYQLVNMGTTSGTEVDEDARNALQQDHSFVESLVATGRLQDRGKVALTREQQLEMENLYIN